MSCVFISENANNEIKTYLKNKGKKIIEIKKTNQVYEAISSHADIYICKVENEVIIEPDQEKWLHRDLINNQVKYRVGLDKIGYQYPENIKYNGVCMGAYFIHNTKYTDKKLILKVKERKLKTISVKQGYTKCNMVVVDGHSLITSDKGIASQLLNYDIDVLLIKNGFVHLDGFSYGFLGGASGRVGKEIIFNGNLEEHPDYESIIEFIESKGLKAVYFKTYALKDIGSIIEVG